jgi:hypothetical protein
MIPLPLFACHFNQPAQPKERDVSANSGTNDWPELAIGLYDRLTGRNAEITYELDNVKVAVPSGVGAESDRAHWELNGTLRIRTRDLS